MSYKQIKWLILIIPTITIGLWEYVRHEFLLPYISMDLGNWLSPVIVFLVTVTFLLRLFKILEEIQDELNREKAIKATLEERERIARELHDGIAQSLFLLSIKVDKLEKGIGKVLEGGQIQSLKKTVGQANDYVRQAISSLRHPATTQTYPWIDSIQKMVEEFKKDTGLIVDLDQQLSEEILTAKEKVELYSCIREALINIQKHADAEHVWIRLYPNKQGWVSSIEDDGRGFVEDPFQMKDRFGLKIMRKRAEEMGWHFEVREANGKTTIEIRKGG